MGACTSQMDSQSELKKSILSSFIPDSEWDEFSKLWTCESYAPGKNIILRPTQAMYVVLSGQVQVFMQKTNVHSHNTRQSIKQPGMKVETFHKGEIIHMFSNKLRATDGTLVYKAMQVSFMPFPADGVGCSVASISSDALQTYLDKPRNDKDAVVIDSLRWLAKMNVGHLLSEKNMTYRIPQDQVRPDQATLWCVN